MLIMRIYALYGRDVRVLVFLVVISAILLALGCVSILFNLPIHFAIYSTSPDLRRARCVILLNLSGLAMVDIAPSQMTITMFWLILDVVFLKAVTGTCFFFKLYYYPMSTAICLEQNVSIPFPSSPLV